MVTSFCRLAQNSPSFSNWASVNVDRTISYSKNFRTINREFDASMMTKKFNFSVYWMRRVWAAKRFLWSTGFEMTIVGYKYILRSCFKLTPTLSGLDIAFALGFAVALSY